MKYPRVPSTLPLSSSLPPNPSLSHALLPTTKNVDRGWSVATSVRVKDEHQTNQEGHEKFLWVCGLDGTRNSTFRQKGRGRRSTVLFIRGLTKSWDNKVQDSRGGRRLRQERPQFTRTVFVDKCPVIVVLPTNPREVWTTYYVWRSVTKVVGHVPRRLLVTVISQTTRERL